jgi:SPP1 family phage portal protein
MDIEKILELGDYDEIIKTIQSINEVSYNPQTYQDEYAGKHAILDRLNKVKTDEDGKPTDVTITAKLVLNYQKKIVETAIAFLLGKPVSLNKTTEGGDEAFQYLKDALDAMKWHSNTKKLARKLFIQRRAAKLFFIKNADDKLNRKVSELVLDISNGNMFPNFADNGDLDAFLRTYKKDVLIEGKIAQQEQFELYTAETIYKGAFIDNMWNVESTSNPFKKIPVVYYEQEQNEWEDVQTLIERQELSISELTDTNQYFSAPIAKLYGTVTGMAEKGEQGKLIQCEMITDAEGKTQKSDVEYLTWDQRPESLNLQLETIEKAIYSFSHTPDISFASMIKNKPGNISGAALEFLMLDAIIKSLNKQELFNENLQRELSVIMTMLGTMETKYAKDYETMKIDISFNSILPNNLSDIIDTLTTATANEPIMSQETAVQLNPMIKEKEQEIQRLKELQQIDAGTFNL